MVDGVVVDGSGHRDRLAADARRQLHRGGEPAAAGTEQQRQQGDAGERRATVVDQPDAQRQSRDQR